MICFQSCSYFIHLFPSTFNGKLLERVGVCNHQHFSMGSTILIEKHEESCAYASNFKALRINEHKWMKYGQDCSKHIIY